MLPRRLVLAIFLLAVLGLTARISTTDTVLIASGSAWKYHDRGANLGTTWRTRSYVDRAWAAGSAQLGYGDGDEATVVRYGPNSAAKYITTYFRQTFSVADPALVQSLTLKVLRDDGAVVYLNGTEVFRTNMPAGTIAYNTLAPVAAADADETTYYTASIDPALLTAGANVLAVEVHQANGSSSDVSFDAELIARLTTSTVLIASGSAWKYHDRGADLGTTWRTRSYVDSAWAAGSAQLGYGDGDEATVVRYGPKSAAKYITTYFRQTFSVADPALVQSLTLKVLRDDGAVVYLNGTEVF